MLVGYSKIGYLYLFLPPACIRGPPFICPYRPCPRLLSEARPLIESRSLYEDLRYIILIQHTHTQLHCCLQTHTHTHQHACTHTITQTNTHTHTQTCTQTHTLTHITNLNGLLIRPLKHRHTTLMNLRRASCSTRV